MTTGRFDHRIGVDSRGEARAQSDDDRSVHELGSDISLGDDGIDDDMRSGVVEYGSPGVDYDGDIARRNDAPPRIGGGELGPHALDDLIAIEHGRREGNRETNSRWSWQLAHEHGESRRVKGECDTRGKVTRAPDKNNGCALIRLHRAALSGMKPALRRFASVPSRAARHCARSRA